MNENIAKAFVKAQQERDHHAATKLLRQMFPSKGKSGAQESRRTMTDRLISRTVYGAGDCWVWTGPTNEFGYGRMTHKGRLKVVHRLSYEAFKSEIPDGLYVLHKCDNPSCINPDHLWLGTYSDNLKDAWAKGRHTGRTGMKGCNQWTK